jgi:hypothetical protein
METRSRIGWTVVSLIVLLAGRAHAVDVASCGQVVPKGETGRLITDLSCSPDGAFTFDAAVTLEAGAALDLAGHLIEMGHDGYDLAAVNCLGRCAVTSSAVAAGEIVGTGSGGNSTGILVGGSGRGRIANVHVQGFSSGIIGTGSLNLSNVTVADNVGFGAHSSKTLRAIDVAATGNSIGLGATRTINAERTIANANRTGLLAHRRVRGVEIQVTGNNAAGIECWDGLSRGGVSLRDSSVTGSVIYDLLTGRLPRLINSTCGTSHKAGTGDSWGICTND